MDDTPSCQLYLISPPEVSGEFSDQLQSALEAGPVAAFQFRVKDLELGQAIALAKPLKEICDAHDVAFVVNDDVVLAKELGASGLHLGQGDMPLKQARAELGDQIQIGITCHDSRHMAMEAGEGGANYVAFGAFFATQTKETSHRPDPDILRWWSTMMEIPCVAIGGITPENCRPLVEAGADFLAVSGAVWNDPKGSGNAVREFHAQLDNA